VGPSATNNSAPNRARAANSSRGTGSRLCLFIPFLAILLSAPLSPSQVAPNKLPSKFEAQESAQPANSTPAPAEKNAAQIDLLETKYRFEANGDSRKEVQARVRINNELGVRQFARLNFAFNRSFQAIEIPMVRITHPSGGVADILPSAITDNPNPAVVDAPAYQDVRVKSVRILGLQPGDLLEYRVVTTTTHHPLAPDFWLDHTFDRSGVVSKEIFEIDFPITETRIDVNPKMPVTKVEKSDTRATYHWDLTSAKAPARESSDVVVTTFRSWDALAERIETSLRSTANAAPAVRKKAAELFTETVPYELRLRASYDFVARHIVTVDLPLGSTAFQCRTADDILLSGYGTMEDKYVLFHALASESLAALTGRTQNLADQLPAPSLLSALIVATAVTFVGPDCEDCAHNILLDPAVEVAPFGMIPANIRGKEAVADLKALFQIPGAFLHVPDDPPFPSTQRVTIDANVATDGTLSAKVKYRLRGDNELLLRVAFHQTPKEKWKDVAQLFAISDGFRGQITNVAASDPYATKEPFTVEYEITQAKFIDWSKKPVRIPALLPLPGLPDTESSSHGLTSKKSIDLGTPLVIELDATVQLPEGTTSQPPTGTSVERDYATFSSKYSAQGKIIRATRKLHFISRELPATRAGDLNAFLHAVQSDQSQLFVVSSK